MGRERITARRASFWGEREMSSWGIASRMALVYDVNVEADMDMSIRHTAWIGLYWKI
jgi:hypothetical protein